MGTQTLLDIVQQSFQELISFIKAGNDKKLTRLSAAALAVFTADGDTSRKKKIGAAGLLLSSVMSHSFIHCHNLTFQGLQVG